MKKDDVKTLSCSRGPAPGPSPSHNLPVDFGPWCGGSFSAPFYLGSTLPWPSCVRALKPLKTTTRHLELDLPHSCQYIHLPSYGQCCAYITGQTRVMTNGRITVNATIGNVFFFLVKQQNLWPSFNKSFPHHQTMTTNHYWVTTTYTTQSLNYRSHFL